MLSAFKNLFIQGTSQDLSTLITEGALLVDVRTPLEFAEGSVKGAINIPLDQIQSNVTSLKNKKYIIVFCRSGSRSSQAKSILEQNGFTNVTNGGTWQNVKQYTNNKIK